MQLIIFLIFLFCIKLFSIVPFRLLYSISNFLKNFIYHVISYRRKIILNNLHNSFPDLSEIELHKLLKSFYQNLLDIVVESIKGFSMSSEEVIKRHKILNPELIDSYFNKGQSVICVAAHYCNWEWGAFSGGTQLKHKIVALYKPMSNRYIDAYLRKQRAKSNITMASIYETTETFKSFSNQVCAYVMVADQSPANYEKAYWINFLNQDTACLHGPEKHSRENNLPVIYLDIQRKHRGYYTIEASLITDNPAVLSDGEITLKYMKRLEQIIQIEPSNWLWSHRRWKKQRSV